MTMSILPTTTITIDDLILNVNEQSTEIQQMVAYLDDWRSDEANQASQLVKTRAALKDLQNSILQQLQLEQQEKLNEPKAPGNDF
ncbi:hypothetical protein M0R04_06935 [Candidatus Dojkabacteria bacterium]|nr:hypothetical protein [Candidatus Dojkabacteria bacterium]